MPILTLVFDFIPISIAVDFLSVCDVADAAEMRALNAMSISRIAMYGIGTIVSNGRLRVAECPSLRYSKFTYIAFFPPSSVSVSPTSRMNSHDVSAACFCASTQAESGPPMRVPKGSDCKALFATVEGVVSIFAITFRVKCLRIDALFVRHREQICKGLLLLQNLYANLLYIAA